MEHFRSWAKQLEIYVLSAVACILPFTFVIATPVTNFSSENNFADVSTECSSRHQGESKNNFADVSTECSSRHQGESESSVVHGYK